MLLFSCFRALLFVYLFLFNFSIVVPSRVEKHKMNPSVRKLCKEAYDERG